ncbi:hypothetical protein EQV77_14910 [Halobacillus fulvus]|nr:hypothetical protein EQV77_14910 [Halobacillus fulvus]
MALAAFIGISISGQLVNLSDLPNLPSIYGALTGSLVLVVVNIIYVVFKRVKNNGTKNENENHE